MFKRKIYIVAILFPALFFGSCEKQLLYNVPESILTTANAFNTAKDLDLAVLGIYNSLQARVPKDFELMEVPSGNVWVTYFATAPGIDEISTLSVGSQNNKINSFWKACYNGIFLANTVLANIDKPTDYNDFNNSIKAQLTGEAKFLRAYYYFDLVRIFGGVPAITSIVLPAEAKAIGRATEEEIYDLIVVDLKDAIAELPAPSATTWGRASKGAAVALLAKVYVYRKDWNNAKIYLDQLFSSEFSYNLVSNYADLFEIPSEQNSEAIFSLAYNEATDGHLLTYDLAPLGGVYEFINNGNRVIAPTWDLRKSFEPEDSRFSATIQEDWYPYGYTLGDPAVFFPYFSKWLVPTAASNTGLDIPLLRLADLILLNAETLYNLNQPDLALVELNKVRARAFGNSSHDYQISDIATTEIFYDKLLLERRLELAVENNRWFDLVRTGRFTSAIHNVEGNYTSPSGGAVIMPMQAQEHMRYFPIPLEQIQLAEPGVLAQNEGYN